MRGQKELVLFLTHDLPYFEHSTFAATLATIVDRAFLGRRCWKCGGIGILDEPHVITHTIDYYTREKVQLEKPIQAATGKDCDVCKGTGNIPVRRHPEDEQGSRVTVHVSHGEAVREAPPDEVLLRYAAVSRRLSHLPSVEAAALTAAWGDEGEALSETLGRFWAATPLTKAGQTMLRFLREGIETSSNPPKKKAKKRRAGKREIEPWRHLAALVEQQRLDRVHPLERRTALLSEMAQQASELLRSAERHYSAQIPSTSKQDNE